MSKGPIHIDAQAHLDQVTADTSDAVRKSAQEKRHAKGFRTARENLGGSGRWRQLRGVRAIGGSSPARTTRSRVNAH